MPIDPNLKLSLETFALASPEIQNAMGKLIYILNPFMQTTNRLLAGRLVLGDNVAAVVDDQEFTMPDDGVAPTLENSFSLTSGANMALRIYKNVSGEVQLRGAVSRATTPSARARIFAWPNSTYVPQGRELFVTYQEPPVGGTGSISVAPDGVYYESGGAQFLALSGVSFLAADRTPPALPNPFPLQIDVSELPTKPRGLVVLSAWDITNKTPKPATMPTVRWDYGHISTLGAASKTSMDVLRLDGLTPGRKYRVKFAAFA